MAYCLKCGSPLRGHNMSANIPPTEIIKNGKKRLILDFSHPVYHYECLNPQCAEYKKILTDEDIRDEISYLIQELNKLKKELEALK